MNFFGAPLEVTADAASPVSVEPLPLPLDALPSSGWLEGLFMHPVIKGTIPFPLLLILAVPIWWVFRNWWRDMDREAALERTRAASVGQVDYRPAVCLLLIGAILTFHEYYGGRAFYESVLRGELKAFEEAGVKWLRVGKYDALYGYGWWSLSRVVGYIFVPIAVWKNPVQAGESLGLRLAHQRHVAPRVDLRGVDGDCWPSRVSGRAATRFRQLLPLLQTLLAQLVRPIGVGSHVLRAVLRVGVFLSRFHDRCSARCDGIGGDLCDVAALLHDSLR